MSDNAARRWVTQSWRYLVVAGLTALGYLGLVALGLIAGLHYFVAILVAQAITILCAFPYYRRFVFESSSGLWPDFARFLLVWTAGATSGIVVTPLLVELLHWRPFDAQVVAIAIVGVGSFLAHRFFTFPRSEAAPSTPMAITGSRPRVRGMNVSVVIPCYRSVLTLDALVARLLDSLDALTVEGTIDDFEVILVVDGSPDATGAVAIRLAEASDRVTAIVMRRNFGQHNALVAGIRAARHEVVVTLDDDLQHPPEEIGTLLRALDDPTVDLVYAVPTVEEHGVLRSLASHSVKGALRLSGVANANWVGAFRAFRTELRDGFRDVNDAQVNLDVLLSWVTTRVGAVHLDMHPRAAGRSTYGLRRLVRHTLNMVTGYGTVPLKLATWLGFGCGLLGAVLLVTVVVQYFRGETTVPGFTTLAALISLFAGAQMLTIGIIGEYLGRQHFRSMSRPMYVIGEVHSSARSDSRADDEAASAQPPEQDREQRMPGAGA